MLNEGQFVVPEHDDYLCVLYSKGHYKFKGRVNNVELSFDSEKYQSDKPSCSLFAIASVLCAPYTLDSCLSTYTREENENLVVELVERWMNQTRMFC